jgi:hypothetical protein
VQAVGGGTSGQGQAAGYVVNAPSAGPSIHLPGRIPRYSIPPLINPQNRGPQPVGYTQAHAVYPAVRLDHIQQAYSTHNAEVVVVEVRMVFMSPGRVQPQIIHVRSNLHKC